jgi:uncharacterized protein YaiI (UPF0178 family)
MLDIYLDIDVQSVFSQILRAAQRHSLELYVVTRDFWHADGNVHLIVGQENQGSGSVWIAANIRPGDICITSDPGLATSCVMRGAQALSPAGRRWLGDGIDEAAIASVPNPRALVERLEAAILAERTARRISPEPWRALANTGRGSATHAAAMSRMARG